MDIRWSPAAAQDFSLIIEYIRRDSPQAAERVAKSIYEGATSLRRFPHKGRKGRVEGTRELLLPSLPFILVYRIVKEETVEIANVIHGAQKYPPASES
jgi:toxin ParE1/3/4